MKKLKERLANLLESETPSLFLDRDGVINIKKELDYVRNWDEFRFIPGVIEALRFLSEIFKRIIIVTNQRGVGRGFMTEDDLKDIHDKMLKIFAENSVRVDKVYSCTCDPEKDPDCYCRKPSPRMAYLAKDDFPEIEFANSVMVGDSPKDVEFGKKLGMVTVLLGNNKEPEADYIFSDLFEFAEYVKLVLGRKG